MDKSNRRRQNHSCDQCRRSKRRCVPATPSENNPTTCRNCSNLGYKCTYEFVTSRATRKERAKAISSTPIPSDATLPDLLPTPEELEWFAASPFPSFSTDVANVDHVPYNTNFDPAGFLDFEFFLDDAINKAIADSNVETTQGHASLTQSEIQPLVKRSAHPEQQRPGFLGTCTDMAKPAISPRSPAALLHSTFSTEHTNNGLAATYDGMMTAVALRYLSYHSNAFAGPHEYEIECERQSQRVLECSCPETGARTSNGALLVKGSLQQDHSISSSRRQFQRPETQSFKGVTLIGVCRFLDNFSPLYGNSQSRKDRERENQVLTAVVQAFALQYSPTSSDASIFSEPGAILDRKNQDQSSSELFKTAWFNARFILAESKADCSFIHIYAVFLFHLTTVPEEAKAETSSSCGPNQLLGCALLQLIELEALVEQHCGYLGPGSAYRALLQSSIRILKWYGYVRDTLASLSSNRTCVLEDAPSTVNDYDIAVPDSFDFQPQAIVKVCQHSVANIFNLYRKVINYKKLSHRSAAASGKALAASLSSAVDMVDGFTSIYGPWLEQSVLRFDKLPMYARLSLAFVIMFWNLSVLYVVDYLKESAATVQPYFAFDVALKAREYQKGVTSSFVTLSSLIVQVSPSEEALPLEGTNINLPFVAHHANTELVVTALQKAIEHIVEFNLAEGSSASDAQNLFYQSFVQADWIRSIKPVLSCLVSLDKTAAGRCLARPALHNLLNR